MFRPQSLLESKSKLFTVVVLGIMGILAMPIILPHIFHGYHMVHILLHVGGIILAVFITILATFAYSRLKTKRLAFSSVAFGNYIVAESILVIDATWPTVFDIGDLSLLEVGHVLTFVTLGLLALGVFRND